MVINRRKFVSICINSVALYGLCSIPFNTVFARDVSKGAPEEVSGHDVRVTLESDIDEITSLLEKLRGRKLSHEEKDMIVSRLWDSTVAEIDNTELYIVIDP